MTNTEKIKYIDFVIKKRIGHPLFDLQDKKDILKNCPKKLFKFRKFDDFSIDMIENNYVYLAPAETLDDPYDCLVDFGFDKVFKKDTNELKDEVLLHIIDLIFNYTICNYVDKKQLLEIINNSTVNGVLDYKIFYAEISKLGYFNNEEKKLFYNVLTGVQKVIESVSQENEIKELVKIFYNSKKSFGVCSFATKRDNRVMWTQYADMFKGYCVEYEVSKNDNVINNLFPVIYKKKYDNNFIKKNA